MTGLLVTAPLVLPLLAAALGFTAWRRPRMQAGVGIAFAAAGVGAAVALLLEVLSRGTLVAQAGAWKAPFGISIVADPLACLMVVLTWVVGFSSILYAAGELAPERFGAGFFPLVHVLLAGISLSFLTGDLFNLYVGFEIMLMASFVLLAGGGSRSELEGGLKYVTLNLISSAMFLAAVGLLYGLTHTLNMVDLGQRLQEVYPAHPELVTAIASVLLIAFAIKAAVFPLFAWLPSSYHTPPVAVSALFAGMLTKVGVVAMLRVLTQVLPPELGADRVLMLVAVATMVTGVVGAVAQFHVRKVLSWHIISQIGYLVLGLALVAGGGAGARFALTATVFYLVHHIVVKSNLFLLSGVIARRAGSEELKGIGGLARQAPWLALLFAIPAGSLAGIPPLSGFWAKLAILQSALGAGQWAAAAAALAAGLLTLVSMVKIWNEAFWKAAPEGAHGEAAPLSPLLIIPIVILAATTLAIGLAPQPLFAVAGAAADALLGAGGATP